MGSKDILKIAVSGHRQLENLDSLEVAAQKAAAAIESTFPHHKYIVLSCLAEGADRLLARNLVETLHAELWIILPLPESEYLKDFGHQGSIDEFKELRSMASGVIPVGGVLNRPAAYQNANHHLINACDLLVIIWDGEDARGPGGTGEVMELARLAEKPLLWIHDAEKSSPTRMISERF